MKICSFNFLVILYYQYPVIKLKWNIRNLYCVAMKRQSLSSLYLTERKNADVFIKYIFMGVIIVSVFFMTFFLRWLNHHQSAVQCSADKSSHSSTGNNSAFSEAIFNFQVCKLKRLKRRSCWYKVCQNRVSRSEVMMHRTEWFKNEMGKPHSSHILRRWFSMFIRQYLSLFLNDFQFL